MDAAAASVRQAFVGKARVVPVRLRDAVIPRVRQIVEVEAQIKRMLLPEETHHLLHRDVHLFNGVRAQDVAVCFSQGVRGVHRREEGGYSGGELVAPGIWCLFLLRRSRFEFRRGGAAMPQKGRPRPARWLQRSCRRWLPFCGICVTPSACEASTPALGLVPPSIGGPALQPLGASEPGWRFRDYGPVRRRFSRYTSWGNGNSRAGGVFHGGN